MKIEDYEQYWQKGGTYVLPNEVFNNLLCDHEELSEKYNKLFEEYINYMCKQDFANYCEISRPYLDKLLKTKMTRLEIYEYCLTKKSIKENKE